MQIKIIMRHHPTPVRMAIIKYFGKSVEMEPLWAVGMSETGAATMPNRMEVPQNTLKVTIWSSNSASGYLPEENENTQHYLQ